MGRFVRDIAGSCAIAVLLFTSACRQSDNSAATAVTNDSSPPVAAPPQPQASPTSSIPNLQAEILDNRNKTTNSPLGGFDFKNFSYPLPMGWQNPDRSDATLTNGHLAPVSADTDIGMDPDELAERRAKRRIGMSYVTTKYMDSTGDGEDEAIVILKVETTGSAIPQFVYVYEWKDGKPELIWNFRTGDRADGGLKDIRMEDGSVAVELYGQDRFILGETETAKITDDEEQLCCPTYFTRSFYKWNGGHFQMTGKRLTFSAADPSAPPIENMAEIANAIERRKK